MPRDTHLVNAVIDFGTHASGPAWCEHDDGDDPMLRKIRTFDQWPGQPVPSVKNLTALLLDRDGEVLAWGYEAHQMWTEHRADRKDRGWQYEDGFKMRLGRPKAENTPYRSMVLDDAGDDAGELVTKYLRCMRDYVLTELRMSGYEDEDVRWCLTVPAIWNERQKALMRECARRAGFPDEDGRVILAYEPEAAAQHARVAKVMVTDTDGDTRDVLSVPGRRVVVADCGGGTADFTSYRVADDGSLEEIGRISGDARGAKYVNKAIEAQVLVPRLGGAAWYEKLRETCPGGVEDLLAQWERAKLNIAVGHDRPVYLSIGAALAKKIPPRFKRRMAESQNGVEDYIVIQPEEVRRAFDSVVTGICDLVVEQLEAIGSGTPSGTGKIVILLVGGFAASHFLRQRIEDHLGDRAIVRVPPDPQISVLAGAVHFACRPDTRARRARRTYGTDVTMRFEEGVDPESKRIKPGRGMADRCDDRFEVLVTKGDLVPTEAEVSTIGIPLYGHLSDLDVSFYSTDNVNPRYVDDPACEHLGTVTVDLIPVMHLPVEQRSIRVYMKFGETQIHSRVVLEATGETVPHSFNLLTA